MLELRIHGYGGQGTVTLAHLMAQAALAGGKQGQALPSFGVERRGAPVKAVVRISDERILVHSQSRNPDVLVLMSEKLMERGLSEGIDSNGIIVVNSAEEVSADYPVYTVDATGIAVGEGLMSADGPFINVPMLGAAAKAAGISAEMLEAAIRGHWSGKIADKNVVAALKAFAAVAC